MTLLMHLRIRTRLLLLLVFTLMALTVLGGFAFFYHGLEIGITLHKVVADVIHHRFFQRPERRWVTRPLELVHLALCEILILCVQPRGHLDVFDVRRKVHGGKNGVHQIVPGPGPARAEVEDTIHLRVSNTPP